MKEMTASEVSRNFSAVLDRAEGGETVAVTRNGERIAVIVPAPRANGAAVREVFERWKGVVDPDPEWEAAFEDIRAMPDRLEDPWRD